MVYLIELEENETKDLFVKVLQKLPIIKQKELLRYHDIADTRRSLVGYCQMQLTLADMTGIPLSNIILSKKQFGKPYAKDIEHIDFSISHSQNRTVTVATSKGRIGIDIEFNRPIVFRKVCSFFTIQEQSLIGFPSDISAEKFYKLWTLKESYLKYEGKGFHIPITDIEFQSIDDLVRYYSRQNQQLYFNHVDIGNDYTASLCTDFQIDSITVKHIKESLLYENYINT